MAAMDFMVIMNHQNNLPKDRYVNTLFFDTGSGGPGPIMDGIHQAYVDNILDIHGGQIASMTIKAYQPGRNLSGPAEVKEYAYNPTGTSGPAEVAIVLSYFAGNNQGRNRGRMYMGPFNGFITEGERPDLSFRTRILEFGSDILGVGAITTRNWLQHSRTDGSYKSVTAYYVDDAWDTQRRRGAAPTSRIQRQV